VVVREDFDALNVGQAMPGWAQQAAGTHVNASVTDETAASGKNSLRFTDGPGGAVFFPHISADVKYAAGVLRSAFQLRVEPGAKPRFEWRDSDPWYKAGPSVEVTADGMLKASGKELLKIPHGKWVGIEIVCGVGPQADRKYTVAVTLPDDKEPRRFEAAYAPGFNTLGWIGFMSEANEKAVYYVDDLITEPASQIR
jgi:hypothetical protein